MTRRDEIHGIPVKHDGRVIGSADIDKDGVITLTLNSNLMTDYMRESFLFGLADSLSIGPNFIPVVQKNPKAYGPTKPLPTIFKE